MDVKSASPDVVAYQEHSSDHSSDEKRGSITGDVFINDHGAETELKRLLSTRHVTMIALGSSIGMGLWLGSGTSLTRGGPAGIFLGYILAGSMVWAVTHSIGEMAIMYPLPSAFVQWAGKSPPPPSPSQSNSLQENLSIQQQPSPSAGPTGSPSASPSPTNFKQQIPSSVSGQQQFPSPHGSQSGSSSSSPSTSVLSKSLEKWKSSPRP